MTKDEQYLREKGWTQSSDGFGWAPPDHGRVYSPEGAAERQRLLDRGAEVLDREVEGGDERQRIVDMLDGMLKEETEGVFGLFDGVTRATAMAKEVQETAPGYTGMMAPRMGNLLQVVYRIDMLRDVLARIKSGKF